MEICDLTLTEALNGLDKKEFSSQELVQSCLQRIDQVEDQLNSFITVTAELALKQARKADRLRSQGEKMALLGIPVGIKDIFCTKGIETTAGSNILKGYIPPYDATVVDRLKKAGAVIIGKLNLDAFAHGSSGENSDFGATRNPWNLEYVPGGSSSGSVAAVSAGECLFSLGTDTGGSIRLPASFCNLVGLKTTYGRVSRYGVIAMASSLDCPGPLTKTVEDMAKVLKIIAGPDHLDSTSLLDKLGQIRLNKTDLKGLKIGVAEELYPSQDQEEKTDADNIGLNEDVCLIVDAAINQLKKLGAEIKRISLPHTKFAVAAYYVLVPSEISSNLARYDGIRFPYSNRSGKNFWDIYTDTRGHGFGREAKRRIMIGTYTLSSGYYDAYYEKAQRIRTLIKRDFEKAFKKVHLIVAPTSPTPPFKFGERISDPLKMYLSDILTVSANLAGIPSLSLPAGFDRRGLPVGIQLMGPHLGEELLLQVGYAYQQTTNWHKQKPDLAVNG
ncbi:aspartyl/glutamyl-tRNA amidotransferase subunit A [candidate division CPR3 bacterium 4484_211]|uniref:Glutamyl-tRNA(Gln) amidotransferase subunit A n=1 Tax=candidate division CPR3 bacterium 4484_211 TaxID=1968527 RepID=A0A1W9NX21_UNCC3|nr:MAG: aspartyl/glutamyl-tRNA amidotransferase subunit A [candidate division CPR3 bacterium 4484_211]